MTRFGLLILVPVLLQPFEFECSGSIGLKDSPPAEQVEVGIYVHPYFTSLSVDNVPVAESNFATSFGQRYIGRLPAGQHKVTIQSECCFEDQFLISVPQKKETWAPTVFRRRLIYLPARLLLETSLRPLEIWIDGTPEGTLDASHPGGFNVPMKKQKGTRRIRILLLHPTLGEARREVVVKAGRQTIIKIDAEDFGNPP